MLKKSSSPYINRFLSADTIVPGYANPQNLNRYSYVTNNPLRYTDPTGHRLLENEGGGGCSTSGYCPGSSNTPNHPDDDDDEDDGGGGGSTTPSSTPTLTATPAPTFSSEPLSQTSKAIFDEFDAYCRAMNYACGDPRWPYQLNPFKDADPVWLARYESEVGSIYAAQGVDLNSVVGQNLDNPLNMNGQKGMVVQMYLRVKFNPVYNHFLKNVGVDPTRPSNLETYYLVKMIVKNPDAFRKAIDKCGAWCVSADIIK